MVTLFREIKGYHLRMKHKCVTRVKRPNQSRGPKRFIKRFIFS